LAVHEGRCKHRAAAQVFDQILQFLAGKWVIGFDRMTADGFGDDLPPSRNEFTS